MSFPPADALPPTEADGPAAPRSVGAVVHSLRILRHLAAHGQPAGVTATARATGINTSTCFNILRTLAAEGMVSFDAEAKTYRIGLGILEIAAGVIGGAHVEIIRPEMDRITAASGAVIGLWHVTGDNRLVLIDRAFAGATVRIEIAPGRRLPAFAGAVGRVVAAVQAPAPALLRRGFGRVRWQRPVEFDAWAAEVAAAASDGYALDRGRMFAGVDAAGAVAVDRAGRVRYGLSGIAIEGQLTEARLHDLGRELRGLGRRIGAAVFAVPHPEAP